MKSFFDFYTMISEQLPAPAPAPGKPVVPAPPMQGAPVNTAPGVTKPAVGQPSAQNGQGGQNGKSQVSPPADDKATREILKGLEEKTPKVGDQKTREMLRKVIISLQNPNPGAKPGQSAPGNAGNPPQQAGQTPQAGSR